MDDEVAGSGLPWRIGAAFLAVAILVILGLGMLGSQVSGILSTVGSAVGVPDPGAGIGDPEPGGGDTVGGSGSGSGGTGGAAGGIDTAGLVDAGRPDLLIIKTGEITLETSSVGATIDAATREIVALGGYVSASARSRDGDDRASVTFRVPADRWEDALAAARGVGETVVDEHSTTEDVTGKVVDLRARIRNLQATELAFQGIMDRASAIEDVLDVQGELTRVRGEIEQLTATAARLEEQAAFSTLKVVAILPAAVAPPADEPVYDAAVEVEAATEQLIDNVETLTTAGIWFGIVWLPVLLALGVLAAVLVFVGRRAGRLVGLGRLASDTDLRA